MNTQQRSLLHSDDHFLCCAEALQCSVAPGLAWPSDEQPGTKSAVRRRWWQSRGCQGLWGRSCVCCSWLYVRLVNHYLVVQIWDFKNSLPRDIWVCDRMDLHFKNYLGEIIFESLSTCIRFNPNNSVDNLDSWSQLSFWGQVENQQAVRGARELDMRTAKG